MSTKAARYHCCYSYQQLHHASLLSAPLQAQVMLAIRHLDDISKYQLEAQMASSHWKVNHSGMRTQEVQRVARHGCGSD
eukprot:CAMPEP_0171102690 /NCGR_PEP_ID=MMETSP0766_2-20121228/58475_1 /TAXON_ID=439317 /ORGANISM="Gambierdiscus australes, Strain CAWD 149" /LENGTH=78 /DNA_ID=CAMNT_0011563027 /DNA_START=45 /DNA_END=278 /DNA_ORIENTATION=-